MSAHCGGRPLGQASQRVLAWLARRPRRAAVLARALGIDERRMSWLLKDLRRAGYVNEYDRISVPRARRPVARFCLAETAVDPSAAMLQAVMQHAAA